MKTSIVGFVLLLFSFPLSAETVKDREGAVRADKAKMETSERWIYNDFEAGFEEAQRTGKPLMVVLRCVPCLACMGIDSEVLVENFELRPLMDQFVLVRVINANDLDLSKFQFDYDLSFSTLFFNGDGTIYGRYGSWEHQRDSQNKATATFKSALEGALRIHAGYPENQASLAGKQGKPSRYKTPVAMPGLQGKYSADLNWNGQVVQSCVHCHQIGDVQRLEFRDSRQLMPLNLIYPHPAPETIGLTLDDRLPNRIANVAPNTAAAEAGLRPGDLLLALSGQPLISSADISWVLHHAPDANAELEAFVQRGQARANVNVPLPDDWRSHADISRRVGTWPMRAMAFGGIRFVELEDSERRRKGFSDDQLALEAAHVGQYNKHAAAKREGWQQGDLLIEVDGNTERLSESGLLGRLIRDHQPGTKVPVKVRRSNKTIDLRIPIQ